MAHNPARLFCANHYWGFSRRIPSPPPHDNFEYHFCQAVLGQDPDMGYELIDNGVLNFHDYGRQGFSGWSGGSFYEDTLTGGSASWYAQEYIVDEWVDNKDLCPEAEYLDIQFNSLYFLESHPANDTWFAVVLYRWNPPDHPDWMRFILASSSGISQVWIDFYGKDLRGADEQLMWHINLQDYGWNEGDKIYGMSLDWVMNEGDELFYQCDWIDMKMYSSSSSSSSVSSSSSSLSSSSSSSISSSSSVSSSSSSLSVSSSSSESVSSLSSSSSSLSSSSSSKSSSSSSSSTG